jgi:SAM-dependent methyltransferase
MNQNLPSLISYIFENELLIQATFSSPFQKAAPSKITIRPIQIKEKLLFQLSEQVKDKVLHKNLTSKECQKIILDEFLQSYKQAVVQTKENDFHLLTNKEGKTTILKKPATKKEAQLVHNRPKKHILVEGSPLPFLIELGLMNKEGKVFSDKMDKFRQINRFLEMVEDTLTVFQEGSKLSVLDFGCGKAYLSFALFHFLQSKGFQVKMIGLDLKSDVIDFCQKLANKLGLDGLSFKVSDIADYTSSESIDMVVALHACDTATDIALEKALRWKAKVILAAPCCQHELYGQIKSQALEGILQYGILKERFAAIATDAARAQILEMQGYSTQVMEFIESEHTPKNLLIRAILGNTLEKRVEAKKHYLELKKALNIFPALERLLNQ